MKQISVVKSVLKFAPLALAVSCSLTLLSGCSSSNSAAPADATISGTIVAAPVSGADVSVVDADGLLVAETEKTDAAGKYTDLVIPHGDLTQDLIVKSAGGAFIDEATGNDGIADEMLAYVAANTLSNGDSVSATPGSTIIADLVMNHGKSLVEAETAFFGGFGYKPDTSVTPVDATVPAVDASDASKLAGLRAASFSQLAKGLGLSQDDQFIMFTALAQDLSDGRLNGLMGTEAIEIVSPTKGTIILPADMLKRSTNSLLAFQTGGNSEMDLTSTYRIKYQPTMAMAGKSTFTLEITNRSDDSPATDLNPMVMPIMHMVSHEHTTPLTDITNNDDGTYAVTIYYLMPSMMEGASMGTWDLAVTVEDETVHFYPGVMMMPEADTPLVRLKGVEDKVTNMDGLLASRVYTIFKDNLDVKTGNDQFTVFVVAQETMMSFPAVFVGSELSGNILADVTVQMSADDGATWKDATDNGDGMWTANGLDLTEVLSEKDEIRVRLTVDDTVINEVKTTDGKAVDPDVNDFNTFTVTPVTAAMM